MLIKKNVYYISLTATIVLYFKKKSKNEIYSN